MNRKAAVWLGDQRAGYVAETDEGYAFSYSSEFLVQPDAHPISLML